MIALIPWFIRGGWTVAARQLGMSFWELVNHPHAFYLRHVGLIDAEAQAIYEKQASKQHEQ